LFKAFRPVDIRVQSDSIPSLELHVMVYADVAFECFGIEPISALGQDLGFAWLEAGVVVVADF
jgi:hypothetical protein